MYTPRDVKRIRPLLERLAQVWEANPDLRLGQILMGVVAARTSRAASLFYVEDAQLIDEVEDWFSAGDGH